MYAFLNDSLMENSKANIPVNSEGFMFGYGLFETLNVYNEKICFFTEHMNRLIDGCKTLRINSDIDIKNVEKHCYKLIKVNKLEYGAIKILIAKNKDSFNLLISTRENPYNSEKYNEGFKLCFSDIKKNPYSILVYVKSNNYMENILAKKMANEAGYDEAVFLNTNDKLCEGSISNLFFIKKGKVYTPSIECGILPGITRDKVIEIANKFKINIIIGEFDKKSLLEADEVFITNSLKGIMPVSRIEDKLFDIIDNKITKLLAKEYIGFLGEKDD
ncbi:aminotransferase class IV [Brassicibacter mesophilus]|uniref:aminotransferase class IV n=1 Tax=Brassicibacter mesophilus TaxID=745119 RepID=UPI003D21BA19